MTNVIETTGAAPPSRDRGGPAQPMLIVENIKKYFPIRAGLLNKKVAEVKAVDDISFYGLFLAQEIFDSCQFALEDKLGKGPSLPLRLPFKLLNAGGLISSAATLPLIALNPLLGRMWRGSNLIVHFRKPA